MPLVGEREEIPEPGQRLRAAQDQEPGLVQRVVEQRDDVPLQRRVEVDEDVPAGQEVDAREGRVGGQIVAHEHARFSNVACNAVSLEVRSKKRSSRTAETCSAISGPYSAARARRMALSLTSLPNTWIETSLRRAARNSSAAMASE